MRYLVQSTCCTCECVDRAGLREEVRGGPDVVVAVGHGHEGLTRGGVQLGQHVVQGDGPASLHQSQVRTGVT